MIAMQTLVRPTQKIVRRKRAPKGVGAAMRISLALMPEEKLELHKRAVLENRTYSAMARIYMIEGMKADKRFDDQTQGEAA